MRQVRRGKKKSPLARSLPLSSPFSLKKKRCVFAFSATSIERDFTQFLILRRARDTTYRWKILFKPLILYAVSRPTSPSKGGDRREDDCSSSPSPASISLDPSAAAASAASFPCSFPSSPAAPEQDVDATTTPSPATSTAAPTKKCGPSVLA